MWKLKKYKRENMKIKTGSYFFEKVTENGKAIALFTNAEHALDFEMVKEAKVIDGVIYPQILELRKELEREYRELAPELDYRHIKLMATETIDHMRKLNEAWHQFQHVYYHETKQFVNFDVKDWLDKKEQNEIKYGKNP